MQMYVCHLAFLINIFELLICEALKLEGCDHLSYTSVVHASWTNRLEQLCGTIVPQGDLFAHEGQWHGYNKADDTIMMVICKAKNLQDMLPNLVCIEKRQALVVINKCYEASIYRSASERAPQGRLWTGSRWPNERTVYWPLCILLTNIEHVQRHIVLVDFSNLRFGCNGSDIVNLFSLPSRNVKEHKISFYEVFANANGGCLWFGQGLSDPNWRQNVFHNMSIFCIKNMLFNRYLSGQLRGLFKLLVCF